MVEIRSKGRILHLPVFSAGELLPVKLSGDDIAPASQCYLVARNNNTDKAYAVSQQLNSANQFEGTIDFFTTAVHEDFSKADAGCRRWVHVEAIDIVSRRSLGRGYTVLANSGLVTGTNPADIPNISLVLTTADFAGLSLGRPATVSEMADAIAAVISRARKGIHENA